jgi:hypothetical protein
MKTEKESLGFKLFWFLFMFAPKFFVLSFAFLPLQLEKYPHFLFSILLALFWAKNEKDKQDLENKIFELKQLLEDEKSNL